MSKVILRVNVKSPFKAHPFSLNITFESVLSEIHAAARVESMDQSVLRAIFGANVK